jgi:O-antigen ligase
MKILALSGWVLILISIGIALVGGYASGTRLQVLKVNANDLGILAMLTMTGVLWHALQFPDQGVWKKRLPAWIFLCLTIVVVAMSGSRGGAISLVITLLAFSLFKPTRSWGVLSLIVMSIAAVSAPYLFDTLLERFALADGDTALGGREALWEGGWRLIREFPLLGVGVGNSPFQVLRFLNIAEPAGLPLHNPVLVVWSETGILGLVLYLAVPFSATWSFLREYSRSQKNRAQWLTPYFAVVGSVFLGYMASWIKAGGVETDGSYYLMVALLVIPSRLNITDIGMEPPVLNDKMKPQNHEQHISYEHAQ